MGYRLREIAPDRSLCQELSLDALRSVVPLETIESVLTETGIHTDRERKLNMVAVVLLVIVMNLYTHHSIGHVMEKLIQGLRFIWPTDDLSAPTAAAISYRRYQLGARPLAQIFRRICRPLATPETPGAFRFGLRLMAVDGTTEMVPDTPENARVFGRYSNGRGQGAYPHVQGMYLVECGTHAIVDAGFWPCHHSERDGCRRLLRSVGSGMLLLWDRGLHDGNLIAAVRARGAHVLGRLPAHVKPRWVRKLSDGSYLARLTSSIPQRHHRAQSILIRVIVYTVTDPARPGYGEIHRLITTLRSPTTAPAVDLVCAYHERWEIELVIDELATHQRLAGRPLRSLKPLGVMQELYGLLIAHYAIRFLMHEAAMRVQIDPDRLSFTQAVCVVQDAIPEFQMISDDQVSRRYQQLLQDIAASPLPPRRERINPRVVKRKQSKFDVKRPEHRHWPKLASPFRTAVSITTEKRARRDRPARLLHLSKSSVWSRLPEPMDAGEIVA